MSKELHDEIMSIEAKQGSWKGSVAYACGHRDALNEAAELALSYTAGAAQGGNTSDNITESAANKAAEEGGLPALPSCFGTIEIYGDEDCAARVRSIEGFSSDQMRAYALDAVFADRASRQVANKAEVEQLRHEHKCMADAIRDAAVKAGICHEDACLTGPHLLMLCDDMASVINRATPPATTGASTVVRPTDDELWDTTLRDRDAYHEWADKLADAISKHFGVDIGEHSNQNLPWAEALEAIENAEPVGASTVLTDGRKPFAYVKFCVHEQLTNEGGIDSREWYEFCEPNEIGDDKLPAFPVYDEPVREVAAQAGQVASVPSAVAVPEGFVLMPKRLTAENGAKSLLLGEFKESIEVPCPECDGEGDEECLTCENFGEVAHDISVSWDNIKAIYEMAVEHLAAPSPAKESK